MVNQIEIIRSQLDKLTAVEGKTAAAAFDNKLREIEDALIQRKATGQGQDTVRYPPKLLSKIGYLAGGLGSGDFGPTKQQREVQALLKQQLAELQKRLDALLNENRTAFKDSVKF